MVLGLIFSFLIISCIILIFSIVVYSLRRGIVVVWLGVSLVFLRTKEIWIFLLCWMVFR